MRDLRSIGPQRRTEAVSAKARVRVATEQIARDLLAQLSERQRNTWLSIWTIRFKGKDPIPLLSSEHLHDSINLMERTLAAESSPQTQPASAEGQSK